ncbi:MAG: TIGR04013 family B12-binding domain/radical SAM domain-containing protein [Asgard group archaeon]|nr:TIGR04013 family B12-binding domain/radical SAM domain-containing protein [Asgard group archaeon]
MDVDTKHLSFQGRLNKLAIVFHYSRANIYSYHALIGALETNPELSDIPFYFPKPGSFLSQIDRLFSIERFQKLIVCFSLNTFQLPKVTDKLQKLATHPNRKRMIIILGGAHATAKPKEMLSLGADIIVLGEGEKTFTELISKIKNQDSIDEQKGIAFLDFNGTLVKTSKNKPIVLDDYPPFAPNSGLYSALEITRGCKFGCTYCQVPEIFGKNIRHRSPETIIKWGKFLLSKRENWDFRFITPNAFGYGAKKASEPNIEMIEKLLSGLYELKAKKRKRIYFGTFPSEVRPESITEDVLALTKKYCNNDNLIIGAQSGSSTILEKLRRGHTIEQVLSAVKLAHQYDFSMNIDFIIGFPEETDEDQFQTIDLCRELIKQGCNIHMHYLIPLPGTKYELIKPQEINSEVLQILKKWTNDGSIFGSWQHQYDLVYKGKIRDV